MREYFNMWEVKRYNHYRRIPTKYAFPIIGKTFGNWTITDIQIKRGKSRQTFWHVACICGDIFWKSAESLEKGRTSSCRSCARTVNNLPNYIETYFKKVKERAQKLVLDLNITASYINDLYEKQNRKCAITKIEIYFVKASLRKLKCQTASLDRIDNTKGYIEGNVQWVHKDINNMKYTFTQEYFINLCKQVYLNNIDI